MSCSCVLKLSGACMLLLLVVSAEAGSYGKKHRRMLGAMSRHMPHERETTTISHKPLETRVARGDDVAIRGRLPYMVSVRNSKNKHACGGVLIAPSVVLTAAHCVHPASRRSVGLNSVVVVGAFEIDDDDSVDKVEMIRVEKTIIHDDFDPARIFEGFDIAVLLLETPSGHVPVGLPDPSTKYVKGEEMYITGWGASENEGYKRFLQQASINFVPKDECGKDWGQPIHPSYICAQYPGVDTCFGDSGGPLLKLFKGGPKGDFLHGLTSFGEPTSCGNSTIPGIYVSVAGVVDWIREKMDDQTQSVVKEEPATVKPAARKPSKQAASNSNAGLSGKELEKVDSDLFRAVEERNTAAVKDLLQKDANINARKDGMTPLLMVVEDGDITFTKFLITVGANLEERSEHGWTPLIRASHDEQHALVRILAGGGANVDAVTSEGTTALMHAAFKGQLKTVKVLLDLGAKKNIRRMNGSTAFNVVCGHPSAECPSHIQNTLKRLLD